MNATSSLGSQNPTELFTTGKNYLLSHDFSRARSTLEKCLEIAKDPTLRLDVHNLLGQCCYALGEKELSCSHFRAGIEINDQSERGRLITGFCLSWLGQHEAGIVLAQKVLESNPKKIEAYVLLLKIYQKLGSEEKAMEMITKIQELEEEKEKEMEREIRSVLPNNVVRDDSFFEKCMVPASDTERVKKVLLSNGMFDLSIGQYQEALDEFNELLSMVPDHAEAMYGASCCHIQLGQKKEAYDLLTRALKIRPDYEEAKKLQDSLVL